MLFDSRGGDAMKYIRFTVQTKDNHIYEYAKSYRKNDKMPPCPYHWSFLEDKMFDHLSTEFCTQKEKRRIARRSDQRFVRDLIERMEALN